MSGTDFNQYLDALVIKETLKTLQKVSVVIIRFQYFLMTKFSLLICTLADIISTVEFDHTGNYLATGDKGGRVVLFERNDTVRSAGKSVPRE